jgi:thioredoxin-related protein
MLRVLITSIFFLINLTYLHAQSEGIQFESESTWKQILEKAKADHKYIFIDCYATWCGPCKEMDANVYTQKEVGDVYNREFISVKIQMDSTLADNTIVKSRYVVASMLTHEFNVNAYPTFLFLDPDGKPVHKAIGSRNAIDFIKIANDAKNPEKQYYTILKYFKPGEMDTAKEKDLAFYLENVDKQLAEKLALDYLIRIPKNQLELTDNKILVFDFQDNQQILQIAIDYVKSHKRRDNLGFILSLRKQPKIKSLAIEYIINLDNQNFSMQENLEFVEEFGTDSIVREIAEKFIGQLSGDSLYQPKMITFISTFTKISSDRGFQLFYHNAHKVDSAMKDNYYAEDRVQEVINQTEFTPLFNICKAKGTEPDWKGISESIKKKYNKVYANRVILDGKLDWYKFLVIKKKQEQYWPSLISSQIAEVNEFRYDTLSRSCIDINNICYAFIFLHSNDHQQLQIALDWMKRVVSKNPNDYIDLDTYASLYYKDGKVDKALEIENRALQMAVSQNDKENITLFGSSVKKMNEGEKIWLEKEYLGN